MTPEEFLRDKYKLVDFHNLTINGYSWLDLMKEYHKEMVEKAGGELSSEDEIKDYSRMIYSFPPIIDRNSDLQTSVIIGANWMKQQASVAIAKEKGKYDNLKGDYDALNNDHQAIRKANHYRQKQLEQKDKEIVELLKNICEWNNKVTKLNKEVEELKADNKSIYYELKEFKDSLARHFNNNDDTVEAVINYLNKIINTNKL